MIMAFLHLWAIALCWSDMCSSKVIPQSFETVICLLPVFENFYVQVIRDGVPGVRGRGPGSWEPADSPEGPDLWEVCPGL